MSDEYSKRLWLRINTDKVTINDEGKRVFATTDKETSSIEMAVLSWILEDLKNPNSCEILASKQRLKEVIDSFTGNFEYFYNMGTRLMQADEKKIEKFVQCFQGLLNEAMDSSINFEESLNIIEKKYSPLYKNKEGEVVRFEHTTYTIKPFCKD